MLPRTPESEFQSMKPMALAVLAALLSITAAAQITLTTYYVLPPTSGCNGLVAMGPASNMWGEGCTAPYLYVVEPSGCAQGPDGFTPFWISGDTVYSTLCSTPCQLSIWDASVGECVILCQLPVITSLPEDLLVEPAILIQNPVAAGTPLQVSTTGEAPNELTLFDAHGRIVERIPMASATRAMGRTPLTSGPYLLRARFSDGRTTTVRVMVE